MSVQFIMSNPLPEGKKHIVYKGPDVLKSTSLDQPAPVPLYNPKYSYFEELYKSTDTTISLINSQIADHVIATNFSGMTITGKNVNYYITSLYMSFSNLQSTSDWTVTLQIVSIGTQILKIKIPKTTVDPYTVVWDFHIPLQLPTNSVLALLKDDLVGTQVNVVMNGMIVPQIQF